MNKLTIDRIFFGMLALGGVIAGVIFPDFGLGAIIGFSAFTLGQFAVYLKMKSWIDDDIPF